MGHRNKSLGIRLNNLCSGHSGGLLLFLKKGETAKLKILCCISHKNNNVPAIGSVTFSCKVEFCIFDRPSECSEH